MKLKLGARGAQPNETSSVLVVDWHGPDAVEVSAMHRVELPHVIRAEQP